MKLILVVYGLQTCLGLGFHPDLDDRKMVSGQNEKCAAGIDNDELFQELFGKPELGCWALGMIGAQGAEFCKNPAIQKACAASCKHPCIGNGSCRSDDAKAVRTMLKQTSGSCGATPLEKCTCADMLSALEGKENLCSTQNGLFWSCACGQTCAKQDYDHKKSKPNHYQRTVRVFGQLGEQMNDVVKEYKVSQAKKMMEAQKLIAQQAGSNGAEAAQKAIDDELARKRGEALARDPETRLQTVILPKKVVPTSAAKQNTSSEVSFEQQQQQNNGVVQAKEQQEDQQDKVLFEKGDYARSKSFTDEWKEYKTSEADNRKKTIAELEKALKSAELKQQLEQEQQQQQQQALLNWKPASLSDSQQQQQQQQEMASISYAKKPDYASSSLLSPSDQEQEQEVDP